MDPKRIYCSILPSLGVIGWTPPSVPVTVVGNNISCNEQVISGSLLVGSAADQPTNNADMETAAFQQKLLAMADEMEAAETENASSTWWLNKYLHVLEPPRPRLDASVASSTASPVLVSRPSDGGQQQNLTPPARASGSVMESFTFSDSEGASVANSDLSNQFRQSRVMSSTPLTFLVSSTQPNLDQQPNRSRREGESFVDFKMRMARRMRF